MKKNFITLYSIAAAVIIFTACGNGGANREEADTISGDDSIEHLFEENVKPQKFVTDSVIWTDSLTMNGCKAKITLGGRYPVAGPSPLVDSVRAWIGREMSYTASSTSDPLFKPNATELASGKLLLAHCGKALMEMSRRDFRSMADEDFDIEYEFINSFRPVYQTDKVLTYSFSSYSYMGGAHGSSTGDGQTFVLSSGQGLTARNMFRPGATATLTNYLRKALWDQYFKTDAEPGSTLADVLLIRPEALQLPVTAPQFGPDGLIFIYQQYEIAPYCYGMPSCVLPYEAVKPLMNPEVADLLP